MTIGKGKRVTISITPRTKEALDKMKHPGQSYDGLIRELIRLGQKEQPEKKGRQVE